jgi:tRNA(Ile)-lysidine synthase
MPRSNVVEAVLRACRGDAIVAAGGPVVVAVSGGADSTVLLHALSRAAPRLGLELVAAHLDHGLRRESRGDARAVAALCAELGVPLVTERTPAGLGRSEDAARRSRYRFLERTAKRAGAATIALGHTADDQVETVLLHLLRGSGLEGLAAMSLREGLKFRPILGLWRVDIEAHCRRHGLSPIEDGTNHDRRFLRNRVRYELLPELESYNPRIKRSLLRLADAARDEHAAVTGLAAAWLEAHPRSRSRRALAGQPDAVRVEVLRRVWDAAAGGGVLPGDAARLRQGVDLIAGGPGRGMIDLGAGLQLRVDRDRFEVDSKAVR